MTIEAIIAKAADVLGGRDAALLWIATPALGLGWQRPIDLLDGAEGRQAVVELLDRMEHGVYS